MDAMFIHLFLSPVTNGLIIQLSPWLVILCFLMGRAPPGKHLHHSLSLQKDMPEIPQSCLSTKVL